MHPSSFYDLQARYVYTPLYGPYSLSEALEGLVSYSLDESRDSISIGSKRTLHHKLISELSNVVDDLQDYLIYFSSKFLISPSDSPDLLKELRAGCDGFELLSIYWGAIISRLIVARKIVEHNFWPHLFQPTIDKLAAFQKLKQSPPFVLPHASSNKLSTSAFTFVSSSHMDSAPRSSYCPLEFQLLPFNVRSGCLQSMPSETDPTGDKESRASSSKFNTTPTLSGLCSTRIPSNRQPSDIGHQSHFPLIYENRSDGVFQPPKLAFAAQHLCSSPPAYTSNTKEFEDLKGDVEAVGIEEQATREIEATVEGARVTQVPCSSSHPVQLTSSHADSSTSEHITAPATSSSFSMSQFMSLVPNSMPSLVHSPATPRHSLELQPTYPTSGTFQPCQGDQWSPREPPSPVAIDNVCDTSSSMHDSHSISPPTLSCDLYRYPASLDSCPSTPFFQR